MVMLQSSLSNWVVGWLQPTREKIEPLHTSFSRSQERLKPPGSSLWTFWLSLRLMMPCPTARDAPTAPKDLSWVSCEWAVFILFECARNWECIGKLLSSTAAKWTSMNRVLKWAALFGQLGWHHPNANFQQEIARTIISHRSFCALLGAWPLHMHLSAPLCYQPANYQSLGRILAANKFRQMMLRQDRTSLTFNQSLSTTSL